MNGRDLAALGECLDRDGYAVIRAFLPTDLCVAITKLYDGDPSWFRSTGAMGRHGFGRGEYEYFARPLPDPVQELREELYPQLARIAEGWSTRLGTGKAWPGTQADLVAACAAAGQTRPTPLLLRYGPGDFNRLHQDIYGDLVFPLQAIALLDKPGRDFTGGELVLVEGRARTQSRPVVVPMMQGDVAVIPVRERPMPSARGWSRATVRHGVSEVRTGRRHTLGVIFHDAA